MTVLATPTLRASHAAKPRLLRDESGPLLVSDWLSTVFIHLEADPDRLQRIVPFELLQHDGRAFVSIVAFTMRHLRFARGGRLLEWLSAPVANHGFCNVRTYVRHQGEQGIYFLAEWLPNALSVHVGPHLYGLPYRSGRLNYRHDSDAAALHGLVEPRDVAGRLRYEASYIAPLNTDPCDEPSLDSMLVEQYTCFTLRRRITRRFRIWHEPWPVTPIDVRLPERSMLTVTGDWARDAEIIAGHYSPGVRDVWIGRPMCIQGPGCATTWRAPAPGDTH